MDHVTKGLWGGKLYRATPIPLKYKHVCVGGWVGVIGCVCVYVCVCVCVFTGH